MKKVPLLFGVALLLLFSCRDTKGGSEGRGRYGKIALHEGEWLFNFKNEVFVRSLKKLYPQSFTALLDSVDGSAAANEERLGFNPDVRGVADSLAAAFAKSSNAGWKIENKAVTMNACLAYRNSAALDALALASYKRFH